MMERKKNYTREEEAVKKVKGVMIMREIKNSEGKTYLPEVTSARLSYR